MSEKLGIVLSWSISCTIYWIKFLCLFILSGSVNKHGHHRQFLFLVISKKSSPLKPSSQMNQNWVGSTYGRYCIKFPQNRMKGVLWNDCVEILCQQISSYGFREKFNGKSIWLFRPIYMFSTSGVTWVVSQEILMYMD
jgi:hypothetical protein